LGTGTIEAADTLQCLSVLTLESLLVEVLQNGCDTEHAHAFVDASAALLAATLVGRSERMRVRQAEVAGWTRERARREKAPDRKRRAGALERARESAREDRARERARETERQGDRERERHRVTRTDV